MKARAEIASRQGLEIKPELLNERQIEPIDAAQISRDFRVERPLGVKRPAGREAQKEKRGRDNDEHCRNRSAQARENPADHGFSLSPKCLTSLSRQAAEDAARTAENAIAYRRSARTCQEPGGPDSPAANGAVSLPGVQEGSS